MAQRHRSKDGHSDTEDIMDQEPVVSGHGRAGGNLARKIGTRDDETRAKSNTAGRTRPTGADERDGGTDRGDE